MSDSYPYDELVAKANISGGRGILVDDGTSSRTGFTYEDYSNFRPSEAIPSTHRGIMYESQHVYERHGLIKNMIDLMADLTMSGICISHPRPNIQRFFENWFNRVNGYERSERFLNNLYKFGNVIVDRYETPYKVSLETSLKTSKADLTSVVKRKILPSQYLFLNPVMVDIVYGAISNFVDGRKIYGLRFPRYFKEFLEKKDKSDVEKKIIASIPKHMREAMLNSDEFYLYPLMDHDIEVYHYKKEDWESWAKPLTYSILRPIKLLEKAEMADLTALDGAVDHVRIFKLGDKEKGIIPTPDAFDKMLNLLGVNNGAGIRNIVWSEDIDILESSSDIYRFLGDDKYIPIMKRIYAGLGIPSTLTGSETAGGTTNNLISLKTLIKRLAYGRSQLVDFWTKELAIVQHTMGFKQPAEIEFDVPNFGDEEVEKRLWIELADRDIVSHEWVQKRFNANPKLEKSRLSRELNKKVPKRGPFANPNEKESQSAIQQNSDVGGRPPGTPDSEPRTRRFTPRVRAVKIWADTAQDKIDKVLNPLILQNFDKGSMRELSRSQSNDADQLKMITLLNLPYQKNNNDDILEAAQAAAPNALLENVKLEIGELSKELGRSPTLKEQKSIISEVYAQNIGVNIEEDSN